MTGEELEQILLLAQKEDLLGKIIVWLKTKKLYNECMEDCGQKQLILKLLRRG